MPILQVPIHLQDDWDDCGPACAQMVVRGLKGPAHLHEQSAFSTPVKGLLGWSTTPDQLLGFISGKLDGGDPPFEVVRHSTRSVVMKRLTDPIDAVPPATPCSTIALVKGGDHWVVVFGFTGQGMKRLIHVRNPTPDRMWLAGGSTAAGPLPSHADGDGCPAGDAYGLVPGTLPEDEVLALPEWYDEYFLKCTRRPTRWQGKYIAVVPRHTTFHAHVRTTGSTDYEAVDRDAGKVDGIPTSRGTILDAAAVGVIAWRNLQESGLLAERGWREISDSVPGAVRAPLLVERLDGGNPYYLVHLPTHLRGVLAGIDAGSGTLRFARLNPPDILVRSTLQPLRDVLLRIAHAESRDVSAYSGRLVWKMCRETFFSPYVPLAEISAPGQPLFYMRLADERRFYTLT